MVIQKCEKPKKKGFLAKLAWHYLSQEGRKNAHFCAHYLFWPKILFGPKQCKPGKTIKIVVSAEIAQNQNWHLFFEKGVFLTWVKKWVLLTFFLKKKTENLWKIMGCFWTWQNGVLGGLFVWGFNVIVVSFWCVWNSSRSVKHACFPSFLGFCGVAYSSSFLVWKVSVFLCFLCLFLYFVLLLFLFCLLCFGFVVGLFLVLFLVLLLFLFFLFLFFWGGHLTWP